MNKVAITTIAVGVTLAASVGFAGTAFAAVVTSGPGCHLSVADPASAVNVWSSTGRYGCANSATIVSQLKRDIAYIPDAVDVQLTGFGVTISLLPYEPCAAHGSATYYGSIASSAGTTLDGNHIGLC